MVCQFHLFFSLPDYFLCVSFVFARVYFSFIRAETVGHIPGIRKTFINRILFLCRGKRNGNPKGDVSTRSTESRQTNGSLESTVQHKAAAKLIKYVNRMTFKQRAIDKSIGILRGLWNISFLPACVSVTITAPHTLLELKSRKKGV